MVARRCCLALFFVVACAPSEPMEDHNWDLMAEFGAPQPPLRVATLEPLVSIPFTPSGMVFHDRGDALYVGMDLGYCQADSFTGEITQVPSEVSEWMPPGSTVVDIGDAEHSVLMRSGDFVGDAFATIRLPHLQAVQMGDDVVVALRGDEEKCVITRTNWWNTGTDTEIPTELCPGDLAVDRRNESAWVASGDLWLITRFATMIAENVGHSIEFEPTENLGIVSDGEALRAYDSRGELRWTYRDDDALVRYVTGGDAGLVLAAYTGDRDRLVALDAASGRVMLDMESGYADHLTVSADGSRVALHDATEIYIYDLMWEQPLRE